jgi:hypothetical protein
MDNCAQLRTKVGLSFWVLGFDDIGVKMGHMIINLNENCNRLLQISEPNSDPRTQEVTRDCQRLIYPAFTNTPGIQV